MSSCRATNAKANVGICQKMAGQLMSTEKEKDTSFLDELDLARFDELKSLSSELDVVVEAMGIESEEAQTIMGEMDAVWIVMPQELKELIWESGWFFESTQWDGRVI